MDSHKKEALQAPIVTSKPVKLIRKRVQQKSWTSASSSAGLAREVDRSAEDQHGTNGARSRESVRLHGSRPEHGAVGPFHLFFPSSPARSR